MKPNSVKIATRKSALALWQAEHVAHLLKQQGVESSFLHVLTTGDKMQKGPLSQYVVEEKNVPRHWTTGKGLFVKEIQQALLSNDADIAVHSCKDLPVEEVEGLSVTCVLPRAACEDILILREAPKDFTLNNVTKILQSGSIVGTSSARRRNLTENWLKSPKTIEIRELRGNVDTRLKKLHQGEFDAIILARAGVERLGLFDSTHMISLPRDSFPNSPAQGAVAIECRTQDHKVAQSLLSLACPKTTGEVVMERFVLQELGGDCQSPVGAALLSSSELKVFYARDSKQKHFSITLNDEHWAELKSILNRHSCFLQRCIHDFSRSKTAQHIRKSLHE